MKTCPPEAARIMRILIATTGAGQVNTFTTYIADTNCPAARAVSNQRPARGLQRSRCTTPHHRVRDTLYIILMPRHATHAKTQYRHSARTMLRKTPLARCPVSPPLRRAPVSPWYGGGFLSLSLSLCHLSGCGLVPALLVSPQAARRRPVGSRLARHLIYCRAELYCT